MKIRRHKTDSMERRYHMVDTADLSHPREMLDKKMERSGTVAESRNQANGYDTADEEKKVD
jgi:hypothetical protein